jgi:4-hydroxythreonine-4-phosphate dehydrogenase
MNDSRVLAVCEPVLYGPSHPFKPGELSAECGRAAYDTIVRAVRDAQAGTIQAIATAPINKEALALAGLPWRGHTEMLAALTTAPRVAMMFWSEKLRVVLATIHIPLAHVPGALTIESLIEIIELTHRELPRFGIARPRWRASTPMPENTACSGRRKSMRSSPP